MTASHPAPQKFCVPKTVHRVREAAAGHSAEPVAALDEPNVSKIDASFTWTAPAISRRRGKNVIIFGADFETLP